METLGNLVKKLALAVVKGWHLEEERRDGALTDAERLAVSEKAMANNDRLNALADEFDAEVARALAEGRARVEPQLKHYVRKDPDRAGG